MWNAIRGTGLAYGVGFVRRQGHASYSIYRSPNAFKAFSASRKVLEDYISGATPFDDLALEGAISNIVLSEAGSQATIGAAAVDSFTTQVVKDLPKDWSKQQLEKVRKVTFKEMKEVLKDVLLPIFKPESSSLLVTCAPGMQESMVSGFTEMGFKPKVEPLAFFQDDYGLEADGEDGDEDDEDEGQSNEGDDEGADAEDDTSEDDE